MKSHQDPLYQQDRPQKKGKYAWEAYQTFYNTKYQKIVYSYN